MSHGKGPVELHSLTVGN